MLKYFSINGAQVFIIKKCYWSSFDKFLDTALVFHDAGIFIFASIPMLNNSIVIKLKAFFCLYKIINLQYLLMMNANYIEFYLTVQALGHI